MLHGNQFGCPAAVGKVIGEGQIKFYLLLAGSQDVEDARTQALHHLYQSTAF